jgi:hypothetical protein
MRRIALCAALLLSGCGAATHTVSVGGPPPGAATKTVIEQSTVATAASQAPANPAGQAVHVPAPRPPRPARHQQAKPGHGPGRDHKRRDHGGGDHGSEED